MSIKATLFVVDDNTDARDSVCALARSMGLKTESFASSEELLAAYNVPNAACLVVDVRLPGMSGLDLQQELVNRGCTLPVVITSGRIGVKETVRAMKLGAVTVLQKPYAGQELCEAIQNGLKQSAQYRVDQTHGDALRNQIRELSQGESKVLELISTGVPNKIVAGQLQISVRTVEDRRHRIMKKLEVASFARLMELVVAARNSPPVSSQGSGNSAHIHASRHLALS